MSDDLVERLRNTPNWMREGFQHWKDNVRTYDRAPFEAADRIEALQAERDDWKRRSFKRRDERDKAQIASANHANFATEWRQRAETAEAERDAAESLIRDMTPYCVARYSMTTDAQHKTERLRCRANDLLAIRARSNKDPEQ